MKRQSEMFQTPPRPRRVLAHVVDAGHKAAEFACRCGWREWQPVQSVSQAKRGVPCPVCNAGAPEISRVGR